MQAMSNSRIQDAVESLLPEEVLILQVHGAGLYQGAEYSGEPGQVRAEERS